MGWVGCFFVFWLLVFVFVVWVYDGFFCRS